MCRCSFLKFVIFSTCALTSLLVCATYTNLVGHVIMQSARQLSLIPMEHLPSVLPDHLQNVDQHDPELIRYIKEHWIVPPNRKELHLNRPQLKYFSQFSQDETVDKILNNHTNGFFLECGAAKGEKISNTLYLERERNWTGLLIEASPMAFESILSKNRNVYALNACISPTKTPQLVNFTIARAMGGISDYLTTKPREKFHQSTGQLQCLPMFSVLAALGSPKVDYLSLDVEGAEMPILKTLPLDEIDVDVFGVETSNKGDYESTKEKRKRIDEYLSDMGYEKQQAEYDIDLFMRKIRKDDDD